MARALVLAMCSLLAAGTAAADGPASNKTSKVTIETDPPGAKVYFGLKEDGEICTTPCTVDAPVGETAIIVEAENQRSIIERLIVRKRARPLKLNFRLEPAVGTLVVEGGTGGTIKVDDQDLGKAPQRIENVQAGGHHVVVEKNGKRLYDDIIEVEAGREKTVSAQTFVIDPAPPRDDPGIAAAAPPAAPRRHAPAFAFSGAVDIGFRQFTYTSDAAMPTAFERDEREQGQVLVGPVLDIWPTTLLGLRVLPGLSLHARYEYGINPQAVRDASSMATTLKTAWQSLEVSLQHRWTVADAGTIEVGTGYVNDRYRFTGDPADINQVPDVNYQSVRIGGRASLLFGPVEPFVAIEQRLVLEGGALGDRYRIGASVYGVRGALGAIARLGHFEIRLEGGVTLYSWTLKPDITDPTKAKAGDDVIENVTFAVGYVL